MAHTSDHTETLNHDILQVAGNQDNFSATGDYISIPQFYTGRSVFITGGTGFIGKVLVEKLLRSCPDIKNIYMLIRPKRGQGMSARLSDLLNGPLFETLRREHPKQLNKVIPISGDITSEELGISESDQALLCRTVSIVFHSAATIKFDEKLKLAVTINMLGTQRLVALCRGMISLDALIHLSTAYCNCDRTDISEVIYATPYNPDDIISLVNWLPEDMLDKLTPSLLGKRPNTYTFTKALTEHMLVKQAGDLPVAIVRPTIVTANLNEPFAGWVDNFNGPTAILSALGNGMLRTGMCNPNYIVDLLPVDIITNLMITVAWRTASKKIDNLHIYNCCTGQQNPITWGKFIELAAHQQRKYPLEGCVWYPNLALRTNHLLNAVHGVFVHSIPAYTMDMLARLIGKKPFMVTTQQKITKTLGCLQYFSMHQWRFKDDNVQALLTTMSQNDRDTFAFDVSTINWEKYVLQYVLGIREFLYKQRPESVPASRKRVMRFYYFQQLTKVLAAIFTWSFVMGRSTRLNDLWMSFLQNSMKVVGRV